MNKSPSRITRASVTTRHTIRKLAEYQWFLIAGGFLLVILFGFIGFWLAYESLAEPHSIPDLLYFTLQLFALQSGAQVPINSVFLEIARFLAPLISFYVIISVIFVLIYQFRLFLFNMIPSRHVVICGLGFIGTEIVRYYQDTIRVVVIESDPHNKEIETCKENGTIVIIGDATNENILRKAGIQKAKDIFIVAGKDVTNAKIAFACKKILDEKDGKDVQCHLHLLNPFLARAFFPLAFSVNIKSRCRFEFFNIYQISGYCIQKLYPPFAEREVKNDPAHVLILGTGRMGETILTRTIRRWMIKKSGTKITITCIDKKARENEQYFIKRSPSLSDYCNLTLIEMDVTSKEFISGEFVHKIPAFPPISIIYVCIDNPEISLNTAITLAGIPSMKAIPIVVRTVNDEGITQIFKYLTKDNPALSHIRIFPLISNECSKPLIIGGMREILARAIHDQYRAIHSTQNQSPEHDPALKPWPELDEDLKESNRKQADNIPIKLHNINCRIEPLTNWDEPLFSFTSDEIENLAEFEHIRWTEERSAEGWKLGPERNKDLKTNPWLIPYSQLPDDVKEFDRDAVRTIPAILARIDLKVERINKKTDS